MKRVIVCGSRTWRDADAIHRELFSLPRDTTIVHGDAPGADRLAKKIAVGLGLILEPHRAEWGAYGKAAGAIRNREMASLGADLCIAFWDGASTGTRNMMEHAERYEIPVKVVEGDAR
jgi:hypothetical protein